MNRFHFFLYRIYLIPSGRFFQDHSPYLSTHDGGIASHVERKSRYLVTAKLSDKTAETMTIAFAKAFRRVPRVMRKTLAVNNGKEFAYFKQLEKKQVPLFILLTLIMRGSVA